MSAETQNILQLLELRIVAMAEIAESLSLAGAAIASCDIDSLEGRIADQEVLCTKSMSKDGNHSHSKLSLVQMTKCGSHEFSPDHRGVLNIRCCHLADNGQDHRFGTVVFRLQG